MRIIEIILAAGLSFCAAPAASQTNNKPKASLEEHNANVLANIKATRPRVKWKHIVVHHTASEWSTLERIDRFHRRKFEDPDGIEYHFLITNGKKAPEGRIDVGRWKIQKRAIHLFKPEGAPDAIAISLIGNLHERKIGDKQFDTLVQLVTALAQKFDIPPERITTHTRVDGRLTVCPGKHFPYDRLVTEVKKRLENPGKD